MDFFSSSNENENKEINILLIVQHNVHPVMHDREDQF